MATKKENLIEVCRSFSQKVSKPGNKYENVYFFCSAKREVALEEFKEASAMLSELVKKEVEGSVESYLAEKTAGSVIEVTDTPLPHSLTQEQAKYIDQEGERIRAEGISEQEKRKLEEANEQTK